MKKKKDHLGFNYLTHPYVLNDNTNNVPSFKLLRNRLRDHFIQDWFGYINDTPKLEYFCRFKTEFKFENYLQEISNEKLRKK